MSSGDAALYEEPFRWVRVYQPRQRNRREVYREYSWRHVATQQGMWRALDGLSRYIAPARVAKHRLFDWCDARICPDSQLIVIAGDNYTTFGILRSPFHELWSLRLGTNLEDRPRYTPSTTFETFPSGRTAPRYTPCRLRRRPARRRHRRPRQAPRGTVRLPARPARVGRVVRRAGPRLPETSG